MRQSHTVALELGTTWEGSFATEPYETAWATEAIFFVRLIGGALPPDTRARVQIAPEGIHWVDEGTDMILPARPDAMTFVRVNRFGGWLRLVGELPDGVSQRVIVHLVLKE